MSALLEDRITAWVADHPDSTLHEVLHAVPCLQKTAETVLADGPCECRVRGDGQRRYRIAGTAGRQEPVRRVPQAERMLGMLRDGGWHTIGQLWDAGVGRPNSRAAELRKRGFVIEHRNLGRSMVPSRAHEYRLVAGLAEETVGLSVSSASGRGQSPKGEADGAAAAQQLALSGDGFRRTEAA